MNVFNQLRFVRDEIKDIPEIEKKPVGGVSSFTSRIGYALSLGLKEKEIFFFALLQWAFVGLGYLLWVQVFDWIPEEVWRTAEESDQASIVDLILLAWSFVCVGVVAFPVGIFTACMGAAHFLHKQGRESTIASCLQLVLPQSWPVWAFHWLDAWVTVNQLFDRLPGGKRKNPVLKEALYYAWKLGISGILPSLVTGNSLIKSGKKSVVFVKDNFLEVAKLRAGYSALCWIVGIAAYIGGIAFFLTVEVLPSESEIYDYVYNFYFLAAVPLMLALAAVMLLLRPIFVLALCDLYSEHLKEQGQEIDLPANPRSSTSALVVFGCLCLLLAVVYLFRSELGLVDMLSTPYEQDEP